MDIPEGLEELFEQTWFDRFLHYGLMVGAIFQLICIAAIVLIPPKPEEESDECDSNSPEPTSSPGDTSKSTTGGMPGMGNKKSGGKKARKRK